MSEIRLIARGVLPQDDPEDPAFENRVSAGGGVALGTPGIMLDTVSVVCLRGRWEYLAGRHSDDAVDLGYDPDMTFERAARIGLGLE